MGAVGTVLADGAACRAGEGTCCCFRSRLRISYNPTRYPKYIPEAYCLCKGCLTGIYGEENFHFRSTPVYMPTVILRRTSACAGGRYVYTEDYVTIPVGCTCVPEQEKEADSVNSSIDKQEMKLLVNQNDKPASE
ncbi:interleukin-17D isoform X2 [Malaclemys terrapin pileata]|uniref:interleukin-17D isoform X2 n=1 Tax=Malaclemys terrapin pileata TaxID=2991368 RepID=UPI0023A82B82|nr:interleukin-17D isoform X2 [Malaclemys terrapin pileata]